MKAIKSLRGNKYLLIDDSALKPVELSPEEISSRIGLYLAIKNKVNVKSTVFDVLEHKDEVIYINQVGSSEVIANYSHVTDKNQINHLMRFYELYLMKAKEDKSFHLDGIVDKESHTRVQVFEEGGVIAQINTNYFDSLKDLKIRGRHKLKK